MREVFLLFKHVFAILITAAIMMPLCVISASAEPEPVTLELKSKSNILIEASTGKMLYSTNPNEKLPLASVTKIMTMLLAMEAIDSGKISMDDIVIASERAKSMGGSTIFLDTGEAMSVHDLLKGIAVASGNDACVAIAEHIAGSEEGFVALMNSRAAELGMLNTCFKNTNGLDAEGHYSSATDIAIMTAELLKHPEILEFTTIWIDSLRDGKFQLANTNKLIRFYNGANGMKTGSTGNALYCLSGTAKRDDMQLIAVVMGAPTSQDRFADATKLLDYGFANYAVKQMVTAGEPISDVAVEKGLENIVATAADEDFSALIPKGSGGNIRREVTFYESIQAPVEVGDKMGDIILYDGDIGIGSVDIVATQRVERITYGTMFMLLFREWVGISM